MSRILPNVIIILFYSVPMSLFILSLGEKDENNGLKEFAMLAVGLVASSYIQKQYLAGLYPFDMIFSQLILFLLIVLVRKQGVARSVFYLVTILLLISVHETLYFAIAQKLNWSIPSTEIIEARDFRTREMMLVYFFSGACLYLELVLLQSYKAIVRKGNRKRNITVKMAISLALFFIYLYVSLRISFRAISIDIMIFLFALLSCLLAFYFFCKYVENNVRFLQALSRNQDMEKQMEISQMLIAELHRFRHNYLNIIHGFGYRVMLSDSDELKIYYDQITKESRLISNENVTAILQIKNAPLSNLILSHIHLMAECNVPFSINIEKEIGDFSVKNVDLCQVLGIFLDNAREAAQKTENPLVNFDILKSDGIVEMYLYNTYVGKPTTTAKNGERGKGLVYCQHILKKYKNILHNTYTQDNLFVQQLVMPEKSTFFTKETQ